MFRTTPKEAPKLALLAICEGNLLVTGGFPSQRDSNAEIISMTSSCVCAIAGWKMIWNVKACLCFEIFNVYKFMMVIESHCLHNGNFWADKTILLFWNIPKVSGNNFWCHATANYMIISLSTRKLYPFFSLLHASHVSFVWYIDLTPEKIVLKLMSSSTWTCAWDKTYNKCGSYYYMPWQWTLF